MANLESKKIEENPVREDSLEHDNESSDQQEKNDDSESNPSADMTVNSPPNMAKFLNLGARSIVGFQPYSNNLDVHDSNYSQIDSYNMNQENKYNDSHRRNRNYVNNSESFSMNLSTLI